ncbi:MAG TPA: hypothetical protein VN697_06400, partial [Tepidiformaceae bacterium]|nr:hypothetical protein [Tepidiformaceae bacterium]
MLRRIRPWFAPERRTLTAVIAIIVISAFVASATGFWLLFRVTYVMALALPVAWIISWWNTRHISADVERRTMRGQVGQEAVEVIEVRNHDF